MLKQDFLNRGLSILARDFNPATTAHLISDLQKGYCDPAVPMMRKKHDINDYFRRVASLLPRVNSLVVDFRKAGVLNVWIRQMMYLGERNLDVDLGKLDRIDRLAKLAHFSNVANEFCLPIDSQKDLQISKIPFNAFMRTNMENELRQAGIETVLISGGMKDICIKATAAGAKKAGFRTFLLDDLLLEINPQDQYDSLVYCEDLEDEGVHNISSDAVLSLLVPKP